MTWLIFVLLQLIGGGLAELVCERPDGGGRYYPRDYNKCRDSDINTAFNNGKELMSYCGGGRVSKMNLFGLDVTCALSPVQVNTHIRRGCLFVPSPFAAFLQT